MCLILTLRVGVWGSFGALGSLNPFLRQNEKVEKIIVLC